MGQVQTPHNKLVAHLGDTQKKNKSSSLNEKIKILAEECQCKAPYQTCHGAVKSSLGSIIRHNYSSLCLSRLKMAESDILSRQVYVHGSTMLVRPTSPCPL